MTTLPTLEQVELESYLLLAIYFGLSDAPLLTIKPGDKIKQKDLENISAQGIGFLAQYYVAIVDAKPEKLADEIYGEMKQKLFDKKKRENVGEVIKLEGLFPIVPMMAPETLYVEAHPHETGSVLFVDLRQLTGAPIYARRGLVRVTNMLAKNGHTLHIYGGGNLLDACLAAETVRHGSLGGAVTHALLGVVKEKFGG